MNLRLIPRRPLGALIGVPPHVMPKGCRAHEEGELPEVGRCVLDWFWSPVRLCAVLRVVKMTDGTVLWFTPNL